MLIRQMQTIDYINSPSEPPSSQYAVTEHIFVQYITVRINRKGNPRQKYQSKLFERSLMDAKSNEKANVMKEHFP
jgi:hypothetical protein